MAPGHRPRRRAQRPTASSFSHLELAGGGQFANRARAWRRMRWICAAFDPDGSAGGLLHNGSPVGKSFTLEIPEDGIYDVEVVVWTDDAGDGLYRRHNGEAGCWICQSGRICRRRYLGTETCAAPGLRRRGGASHPDNSLQWLAQRIVADERFCRGDRQVLVAIDYGQRGRRVPRGIRRTPTSMGCCWPPTPRTWSWCAWPTWFRRGFPGSPYTYNLKDLLVEIVLSKWFRADAVMRTRTRCAAWRCGTPVPSDC